MLFLWIKLTRGSKAPKGKTLRNSENFLNYSQHTLILEFAATLYGKRFVNFPYLFGHYFSTQPNFTHPSYSLLHKLGINLVRSFNRS